MVVPPMELRQIIIFIVGIIMPLIAIFSIKSIILPSKCKYY